MEDSLYGKIKDGIKKLPEQQKIKLMNQMQNLMAKNNDPAKTGELSKEELKKRFREKRMQLKMGRMGEKQKELFVNNVIAKQETKKKKEESKEGKDEVIKESKEVSKEVIKEVIKEVENKKDDLIKDFTS